MYTSGQLRLDEMITRRYRLDDINDGVRRPADGRSDPWCHRLRNRLRTLRPWTTRCPASAVVEIGDRVATAYCGKLLRDAGADVVMLEDSDGHRLRRYFPVGTPAGAADSPFFAFLAGGKRSVVVPGALPVELLTAADIVILGATPGAGGRDGARR